MRFPEFTDEWKVVTLKDIATRVVRRNKNNESNLPLTISAQYGLVDQVTFFNKTIASTDMTNYYLLFNGDFAYNKSYSNDYPWGALKRLERYEKGCLSSLYFCFRPNYNIFSDYLVHYFESTKWYKGISIIAGEGARNHGLLNMSVEDYFITKHKVPTIEEQTKIAQFLNLIMKRIETQNKIIDKLESLIKGITDTFTDENTAAVFFSKLYSKAGEGGTPSTTAPLYYENGTIPFIKIDDLSEKYITHNFDYITKAGLANSSAWMIPSNCVIYSNGATIGRVSINTYSVATKQGVLGIIPSVLITSEYLYYFLSSKYFRKQVCRITVKGTMECAYLKDLNTIKCYIPSKEKQDAITMLLSAIDTKIRNETAILTKFVACKKHILYTIFI